MDLTAIDTLMHSSDAAERRQAAGMLAELGGSEALDRLEVLVVDANPAVREVAQDAIILLGGHDAVRRVAPLVGSADAGIRNTGIEILRRIGEDGLDILHLLARNSDDRLRLFIVDVLGSIGNHDSVEPLIQCLFDENSNVRNQAVISLGNIGDSRAFEHLQNMINDEEWIRFSVIEAMAKLPHPAVVDFLLGELKRWTKDEITLSAILETLAHIPSEKAVRPLLDMIPAASPYIQEALVRTLLRTIPDLTALADGDIAAIKAVLHAHVREADDDLQRDMLVALGRIGDRESAKRIIELAQDVDPDTHQELWDTLRDTLSTIGDLQTVIGLLDAVEEKLKILAAEVIARIGGIEDVRPIIERLPAAEGYVKRAYVEAIAQIGPSDSGEIFRGLIHDRDGHVAARAIRAMGIHGAPEDIDELKPFLAHPYADVREAALDAIVRIGSAKAQGAFLQLLHQGEPHMRIMGLKGLAHLNAPLLAESVQRLLADTDTVVRLAAVQIARDAGLPLSAATIKTLLQDEQNDIRFVAIDLIGLHRLEEMRMVLYDAIISGDMWAGYHAVESLGHFRDEEARHRLLQILAGGEDFLRIAAAKALGEWQDETLADDLEIHLDDANLDVARAVSVAIDKLRGLGF